MAFTLSSFLLWKNTTLFCCFSHPPTNPHCRYARQYSIRGCGRTRWCCFWQAVRTPPRIPDSAGTNLAYSDLQGYCFFPDLFNCCCTYFELYLEQCGDVDFSDFGIVYLHLHLHQCCHYLIKHPVLD